jgi:serine/threonine protein kinase, bacterial
LREHYRNGIPTDEALQIITAVASALDFAHRRGLLHRDVKPANILLAEPESASRRILLSDFGIVRRRVEKSTNNVAVDRVAYAPPEQLMGEPVYPAADQYSLACTAFHLLTGAPPYNSPSAAAVINNHLMSRPPSIGARRRELARLDPAFAKAMAKTPTGRFPTCQEFTRELHRSGAFGARRS